MTWNPRAGSRANRPAYPRVTPDQLDRIRHQIAITVGLAE
jgi:hypothetical protein